LKLRLKYDFWRVPFIWVALSFGFGGIANEPLGAITHGKSATKGACQKVLKNTFNVADLRESPGDSNSVDWKDINSFVKGLLRKRGSVPLSDIDDVAQEVQISFLRNLPHIDPSMNIKGYIAAIVNARETDYLRKRGRKREDVSLTMELVTSPPTTESLTREEREALMEGVESSLTPLLRNILYLRFVKNFDYRSIANILDIPIGTVKSRINAAVAALQKNSENFEKFR